MMDIQYIRDNVKLFKKSVQDKGITLDIDKLLKLDDKRKKLQQEIDKLRSERNEIAENLKDPKKRSEEMKAKGKDIKDKIFALEEDYNTVVGDYTELMLLVPNPSSKDTPVGADERANKEVSKSGKIPKFKFKIKDHIELGTELDILDLDRGVKVSGFRGYFLKSEGAEMHMALIQYTFNKLVSKGFMPMIVPTIVKREGLVNMGQFPIHSAETYSLISGGENDEDKQEKFLAGTSEVALLNQYSDEILDKDTLPLKMCGFSSCYRSEAGSYGKDTKGLYRVHEFMKIEQLVIAENDLKASLQMLEELREISEEILQDLKLPYHVVITSTGDQGQGKHKMYDIETWMPSRERYCETHSDSLLTDWQSRRANIKYKDGDEVKFAHTLNNTAIASPRILIAIWENYQNEDGSIDIPEVLRPFMSGKEKIEKK